MSILQFYKKNPGLALFFTNIVLFLFWVVVLDPFSLKKKFFEPENLVLKLDYKSLKKITIEFPEQMTAYTLTNTAEVTGNTSEAKEIKTIEDFLNQTQWKFRLENRKNSTVEEYDADRDNLKNLIETLTELKHYYYLPANNENRSHAGLLKPAIFIRIETDKKQQELVVGNVSLRNNSSYVMLKDGEYIFQVEENLKTKTGFEDPYYFRNHRILSLQKDKIEKMIVETPAKRYTYIKAGQDWQILEPKPEKISTTIEGILDEISNLKATVFYNKEKPRDKEMETWNTKIQVFISQQNEPPKIEILEFLGKKDYVKFYLKYKDDYYQVSAFRIEDLLEPEKLIQK